MASMTAFGTEHESRVRTWLRGHGWPYADRRPKNGAKDLGDLRLSERIKFVIEAKNAKSTTDKAAIGSMVKELEVEVANDQAEAGAVILKRRGTTDVGEYYAIMPVKYLNTLLLKAYGEEPPPVLPREIKRIVGRRVITQTIPPTS